MVIQSFWRKNQASVHTYIHINVYDMLRVKTIADIKLLPTFYKERPEWIFDENLRGGSVKQPLLYM